MAVGRRTIEAATRQTAVALEHLASARVVDPTSKEQVPLVIRVTGVQARPRIALFRSPTRCAQRGWRGQAVGTLTPRRGGASKERDQEAHDEPVWGPKTHPGPMDVVPGR